MPMAFSYKRLFKILIDKDMKKKDLYTIANISSSTVTKLAQGQYVSTEVLDKICKALDCKIEDIMEFVHEDKETEESQNE
jgi:DNA-binding Xre family transcriptional regulator